MSASVPRSVKNTVWNMYIGSDKAEGRCYVCNRPIHIQDFEIGHNIAKSKGGGKAPDNLRPICRNCNSSMGKQTLESFKAKYFPSREDGATSPHVKAAGRQAAASAAKCPNCKGKGTLPGRVLLEEACPSCKEKGTVDDKHAGWIRCQKCKGYGTITEALLLEHRCRNCKGRGIVPRATR